MTDRFEVIRERITAQEAAEHYGVEVKRGKARCIWHEDRHPSLSFKGQFCKCFSCQSGGSAIDVTMQLFNLDAKGAAAKLNEDFRLGLDMNAPPDAARQGIDEVKRLLNEFERERRAKYREIKQEASARLTAYMGHQSWDDPEFVRLLRIRATAETELEQMEITDTSDWINLYRNEVGIIAGLQNGGGSSASRGAMEGSARAESA